MKNSVLLLLVTLLLLSCATTKNPLVEIDARSLILEQNSELNLNRYAYPEAFAASGSLAQTMVEKNGHSVLEIDFRGIDNTNTQISRTFSVDLDEAMEFPKKIEEAKVLFLSNNLVVTNLDDKSQINYFVKTDADTKNLLAQISTIDVIGVGMAWDN